MKAIDVIEGRATWAAEVGDNIPWLQSLPTNCARLTITSGPYEDARTYGVGFSLKGQGWVDWMIPRVVEACRVTDGLVCVNMAGKVTDRSYHPVVEWLVADLTRHHGIVCGPAPYVFFRFGIPGSGSDQYHRRDWEPIYCFAKPESLPLKWADNTAMGRPARWAPGGEMSNRLSNGKRVNQWGPTGGANGAGKRFHHGEATGGSRKARPSHKVKPAGAFGLTGEVSTHGRHKATKKTFRHAADGSVKGAHERDILKPGRKVMTREREGSRAPDRAYDEPAIANPGNVIREVYSAIPGIPVGGRIALPDFIGIMMLYANATKTHAGSLLYDLREALDSQALPRWFCGIYSTVLGQAVLRPDLYGFGRARVADLRLPGLQEAVQTTSPWAGLLQRCLSESPDGAHAPGEPDQGQKGEASPDLRPLRDDAAVVHSPQGRESLQQRPLQSGSRVPILSQQAPPSEGDLLSVRETADGARLLSQAFAQIQDVWRSALEEAIALSRSRESGRLILDAEEVRQLLLGGEPNGEVRQLSPNGDVLRLIVGGGSMGHKLAHESEAPFPEKLVEYFVASYCPPGEIVLDPHLGSGTTVAVAVSMGRRGIGCDLRESQVKIARKRIGQTTLPLFAG